MGLKLMPIRPVTKTATQEMRFRVRIATTYNVVLSKRPQLRNKVNEGNMLIQEQAA